MVAMKDYASDVEIAWCPGCGNFGILEALKKSLVELRIEPHNLLFISGIGQGPKLPHYTRGNLFNGLHGRTLPAATGAKLANSRLTVIGIDGDGGAYGEGIGHLLASLRRNVNITYMVHNNQVYGLTKGQASPTSDEGFVTNTTPSGSGQPLNPIALALASDAGFVARGFSGDVEHLKNILKEAIIWRGFALVDILQPCVSFNKKNTYKWYRDRVYRLEDEKGYDTEDKASAMVKAGEWGERIPIGIIYKEKKPVYEDSFPALKKLPLVEQELNPLRFDELLDEFI